MGRCPAPLDAIREPRRCGEIAGEVGLSTVVRRLKTLEGLGLVRQGGPPGRRSVTAETGALLEANVGSKMSGSLKRVLSR